jgi:hypothetical protein
MGRKYENLASHRFFQSRFIFILSSFPSSSIKGRFTCFLQRGSGCVKFFLGVGKVDKEGPNPYLKRFNPKIPLVKLFFSKKRFGLPPYSQNRRVRAYFRSSSSIER